MEDLQNTTRKNKAIFLLTALMLWLKLSILPELNTVLEPGIASLRHCLLYFPHFAWIFNFFAFFFFFFVYLLPESCISFLLLQGLGKQTLVLLSDISSASAGVGKLRQGQVPTTL